MSGYREPRRATDYRATLFADGQEHLVSIGNASEDGLRLDGVPKAIDAFQVRVGVGADELNGIVVWQRGDQIGVRLKRRLTPDLLARIRRNQRYRPAGGKRFLMN